MRLALKYPHNPVYHEIAKMIISVYKASQVNYNIVCRNVVLHTQPCMCTALPKYPLSS